MTVGDADALLQLDAIAPAQLFGDAGILLFEGASAGRNDGTRLIDEFDGDLGADDRVVETSCSAICLSFHFIQNSQRITPRARSMIRWRRSEMI